ncbi:hypothetical protein DAI22_11g002550 [Oryza sativa Japonica Group]|nr:hypothetical protein DAI22_11g002550 [Oryza sativa Japonica Group]
MTTAASFLSLSAPSTSASSSCACPPTPPEQEGFPHAAAAEAQAPDLQRAASSRGATARHPRAGRDPAGHADKHPVACGGEGVAVVGCDSFEDFADGSTSPRRPPPHQPASLRRARVR